MCSTVVRQTLSTLSINQDPISVGQFYNHIIAKNKHLYVSRRSLKFSLFFYDRVFSLSFANMERLNKPRRNDDVSKTPK